MMATIPLNEPVSPAIPPDVPAPSEVDSSLALVQRSISLPLGQPKSKPTSLVDSGVGSEVEPTSHKPSLAECIFGVLSDKPVSADVDTPVEGCELTPPPRAATLPRPSRAQTAAVPRKAAEVRIFLDLVDHRELALLPFYVRIMRIESVWKRITSLLLLY
jgi:hypothetical protein